MARRSIVLEERKQIKIFTNPVRQEMIRLLRLSEVPLTAKDLADRLYLSPAAVQHHLKKLEEIGVVEVDHHARAGDMEVTYYRDADVEVQLQMGRNDGFQGEREALAANLVDGRVPPLPGPPPSSIMRTSFRSTGRCSPGCSTSRPRTGGS